MSKSGDLSARDDNCEVRKLIVNCRGFCKGNPVVRRGRKASGLEGFGLKIAGLPAVAAIKGAVVTPAIHFPASQATGVWKGLRVGIGREDGVRAVFASTST